MRKTDYIWTMWLLLCAATSCSEALEDGTNADGETVEPLFSVGTRFNSADGSPAQGDTYTLISYGLNATMITSTQQRGYYGYDATNTYSENLVPIQVDTTSPYGASVDGTPLTKDRSYAQMLNSIPVSGTNPNNQGIYRTAVIHPAIPVRDARNSGLGYLPVFEITDEIWVSSPDDADGDPLTDDPFEITVTSNGQVHNVPAGIKLYPVKAGLKVYFYSHYFADTDPEQITPLEQTFSIQSMKLVNAGSNGWLNARTGVVYPNYNYTASKATIYSSELVDPDGKNYRDLSSVAGNSSIPGTQATAQWFCDDIRVFPSDYSGNNPAVLPMSLAIVLEMSGGGVNRVNMPVSFEIKRGKEYTFYVNVTSELVTIDYSIADWDPVTGSYMDIGGPVMDYVTIPLSKTVNGWDPVTGGNENIGN